jgi:hypothetical protein
LRIELLGLRDLSCLMVAHRGGKGFGGVHFDGSPVRNALITSRFLVSGLARRDL